MALVEGYQLKPINPTDEDFKYIKSKMIKTLSRKHKNGVKLESYEIIQAFKVWHSERWREYTQYRQEMYSELGCKVQEKHLFHGSPFAMKISEEGFDIDKAKTVGMFGKGIYFAENSSKSVPYSYGFNNGCEKHNNKSCYLCPRYMLICRVALGNTLETKIAMQQTALPKGYHSIHAVPSPGGLKYPEYVIYNSKQAYPGYLVEYKILEQRPKPVNELATSSTAITSL